MAESEPTRKTGSQIATVVVARTGELPGGFRVRRLLPSRARRMVGPFVFVDQMGPEILRAGSRLDVPPHPHIGLATVTYLFEGELLHRDGLGTVQRIVPGEVNWMTAGLGIAHSERTPPDVREKGSRLFGIQTWVALPERDEEMDPAFAHTAASELPEVEGNGLRVRVIAGELFGARSPVHTHSEMFYADAAFDAAATLSLAAEHEERAALVVAGEVAIGSETYATGTLLVFRPGEQIFVAATSPARVMLLGGAPMDGPRHIFWNFVSSSRDRIEQAKEDWRVGRFAPVPDETERIPLPSMPGVVRYP